MACQNFWSFSMKKGYVMTVGKRLSLKTKLKLFLLRTQSHSILSRAPVLLTEKHFIFKKQKNGNFDVS